MPRSTSVDVLKIIAAQMIFWHHLSAYGDMAQWLSQSLSDVYDFLFGYARMAVQIFLVVSGYLTAQHIDLVNRPYWLQSVCKRYLRLTPVYLFALLWVSLCMGMTRPYFSADWLPAFLDVPQVLAHISLLHGLLDYPSLSTGIWYIAIDFQLYIVLTGLVYATGLLVPLPWRETVFSTAVLGMISVSLWWFNLDASWDNWAIYFFGAYGLGFLAGRAPLSRHHQKLFWLGLVLALLSLILQWRWRIALACSTALLLWTFQTIRQPWLTYKTNLRWQSLRTMLADSSYAFFLMHFGVLILFNAAWQSLAWHQYSPTALLGASMLLCAWVSSIALGVATQKWVEAPIHQVLWRKFYRVR
jgi:peptidoglycan/LPS O-acetylase OafA/YrhL